PVLRGGGVAQVVLVEADGFLGLVVQAVALPDVEQHHGIGRGQVRLLVLLGGLGVLRQVEETPALLVVVLELRLLILGERRLALLGGQPPCPGQGQQQRQGARDQSTLAPRAPLVPSIHGRTFSTVVRGPSTAACRYST